MEYNLIVNQEKKSIQAIVSDQTLKIITESKVLSASFVPISDHQILLSINGQNINAFICNNGDTKTIMIKGQSFEIMDADLVEQTHPRTKSLVATATIVASPMPAVVTGVLTQVGDRVKKGQGLIIVSAMKMETTLFAPFDGIVSKINAAVGDKVMPADILVDIEKQEETL
ncbi:MAG: acetyl-CoA carboxylase biotin carboxyl carrier protein subunit [Proteobacteria bacterium]|nr:acetyl-CoA carboxylase biotin carboxyl carrier protein subunit [Pseudomonadota bacterium]MBU1583587.1 acetyl-CoA carboxylase biotin carboxyl carrier protein subunit [Pseudomonadota bacterium]MBU2453248.1 acetyl-CoA carboxylase biotin carboxyl carrier protein subunit [Pseudomonadota bacterium]MBU2628667.1 acetyl-CoA carboxylase biotin carboxyl carrier protein subunit [Pseudomonadota bacterium]